MCDLKDPQDGTVPEDTSLFSSFENLVKKLEELLSKIRPWPPIYDPRDWHYTKLDSFEEYRDFLEHLGANTKFQEHSKKAVFSDSIYPLIINETQVLNDLLGEYMIRRRHAYKYGKEIVRDLYLEWESMLYTKELDCYAICFLEYVTVRNAIDLGDQVIMRMLDLHERTEWEERTAILDVFGQRRGRDFPWYVVEATWREEKRIEPDVRKLKMPSLKIPARLQNLIYALQLFGAPRSHYSLVYISTRLKTQGILYELATPAPFKDPSDFLDFDQVLSNRFTQFWANVGQILKMKNASWWRNALGRYERSILEGVHEDKLVDLIIALEGILLSDPPGELRRTLSQRLAVLNSITPTSAKSPDPQMFETAYESYRLRNRVVHGSISNEDLGKIELILEPLRESARGCLLRFLGLLEITPKNEDKARSDIHECLDKGILQQENRDEIKNMLSSSFLSGFEQILQAQWWKGTDEEAHKFLGGLALSSARY